MVNSPLFRPKSPISQRFCIQFSFQPIIHFFIIFRKKSWVWYHVFLRPPTGGVKTMFFEGILILFNPPFQSLSMGPLFRTKSLISQGFCIQFCLLSIIHFFIISCKKNHGSCFMFFIGHIFVSIQPQKISIFFVRFPSCQRKLSKKKKLNIYKK